MQFMVCISLIILIHVLFYWKFYWNPFIQATSELIQLYFPHWRWLGKTKNPWRDDIFWFYPGSISLLSSFYPTYYLSAKLMKNWSLDHSFIFYNTHLLFHKLLGSVISYFMFRQWYSLDISLFGSILYSYAGYNIKLQDPSNVHMMAWIPACFIKGWVGAVGFGMCLLAGYYPIFIYMIPMILFYNPVALFGTIFGSIQLVPFLIYYFSKSVSYRWCASTPLKEFIHLIIPRRFTTYVNGTISCEHTMYIGLIPLVLLPFSYSEYWFWLSVYFVGAVLSNSRFLYAFTFCLCLLATDGLNYLSINHVGLLSAILFFTLYKNRDIYPCFPFTEWWKKPSEFWDGRKHATTEFPHQTGYLDNIKTKGYFGCLRIKTSCIS